MLHSSVKGNQGVQATILILSEGIIKDQPSYIPNDEQYLTFNIRFYFTDQRSSLLLKIMLKCMCMYAVVANGNVHNANYFSYPSFAINFN